MDALWPSMVRHVTTFPDTEGPQLFIFRFVSLLGSFSIYEQPKWERIVASTQVGFRVSIWVRIRIRVWIRVRIRVRFVLRLFIYRERALYSAYAAHYV